MYVLEELGRIVAPGGSHVQSATKRDAVHARQAWEHFALWKHRFDLARRKPQTSIVGMIVFSPPAAVRQIRTQPVAIEVFRGRVDDITDGTAVVTLFSEDGEQLSAQWPEQDLTKESIGKGDLFELRMTDTGGAVIPSFHKVSRKPIPDKLWKEIETVKMAYSDLFADEVDGKEEG